MRLAEPFWLLLLLGVPFLWRGARARPGLAWPSLTGFARSRPTLAERLAELPARLRVLALVSLSIALARPQTVADRTRIAGQGVAIVVALDHSSSMNAVDFPDGRGPVSRLDAARETVARFVAARSDDLIGLVVFANYPDLACPPTLDHEFLDATLAAVRPAAPGDDGTNLGDAVAWGVEALRQSTPRRKALILLTDGRNSPAVPHPIDPEAAARLARDLGVTLHTIAIGRPGTSPGTDGPDLDLLARLARLGGGRAFNATDARALDEVFRALDALEKSPVQGTVRTRYRERYAPALAVALVTLAVARFLVSGRLGRIP